MVNKNNYLFVNTSTYCFVCSCLAKRKYNSNDASMHYLNKYSNTILAKLLFIAFDIRLQDKTGL